MARDGRGGLWITSPQLCGTHPCNDIEMLHRSAAGTWSQTVVPVGDLELTQQ